MDTRVSITLFFVIIISHDSIEIDSQISHTNHNSWFDMIRNSEYLVGSDTFVQYMYYSKITTRCMIDTDDRIVPFRERDIT